MSAIGIYVVPAMFLFVILYGIRAKIDVYRTFCEGLTDGAKSFLKICPALFALFISVGLFRSSGLSELICSLFSPLVKFLGFPKDLVPFAVLRPVSGSGSLVFASDIFTRFGPDSFEGRVVSVMMGSTETTFYTASVYFAASETKDIRHTLKCALLADLFSMAVSIIVVRLYYC